MNTISHVTFPTEMIVRQILFILYLNREIRAECCSKSNFIVHQYRIKHLD